MSLPTQIESQAAFIKAEQDLQRALAASAATTETAESSIMIDITL